MYRVRDAVKPAGKEHGTMYGNVIRYSIFFPKCLAGKFGF